jgi:protein-S-isoprenylcysteine O-methyltransferase Ste14
MGLPDEETELRTAGIYRISRNPMYVGFLLTGLASCLYAPHPLNFVLLIVFVLIHHQIVIAEEEFLIRRFKEDWLEYRFRVRRYL